MKLLAAGVIDPQRDETMTKAEAQIEAYLKRVERRRKEQKPSWTAKASGMDLEYRRLQSKADD